MYNKSLTELHEIVIINLFPSICIFGGKTATIIKIHSDLKY